MEELKKLWKYHAAHLRELCQRTEYTDQQIKKNSTKFEIGQSVIVMNHVHHTFKPKCLVDYMALKIINDSTLLLILLNGKRKKKQMVIKPCSTTELIENAWDLFLGSTKTKHTNFSYKLRPKP